jgi:hypothetical protein
MDGNVRRAMKVCNRFQKYKAKEGGYGVSTDGRTSIVRWQESRTEKTEENGKNQNGHQETEKHIHLFEIRSYTMHVKVFDISYETLFTGGPAVIQ